MEALLAKAMEELDVVNKLITELKGKL